MIVTSQGKRRRRAASRASEAPQEEIAQEGGMFRNLGRALIRLRERTGKTQTAIARAAHIGKAQLWKYESGFDLPKLESLERVLEALGADYYTFFWILDLIDRGGPARSLTREEVSTTFVRLTSELFMLHHEIIKELPDEEAAREVRP